MMKLNRNLFGHNWTNMDIASLIQNYPDFPAKGVQFKDIFPALASHFNPIIDELTHLIPPKIWSQASAIVGIESRGFIFAAALAQKHDIGFIPIRKQGKLPGTVHSISYDLEYGTQSMEMHPGSGPVILIDDVIATSGTLQAAISLLHTSGYTLTGILAFINLTSLNQFTWNGKPVPSLIEYR